jgi:hypothetical protein
MSEWSCRANRTLSAFRAAGGKLVLQQDRLQFQPHRFDRVLAGKEWAVPLTEIRSVGEEPRGWNPVNGAMRTRPRIETEDGSVELFAVNDLSAVRERIDAAVAAARS